MGQADTLRVRFDAFELDEADARLKRDGAPIALAPKAFAVLCTLARQPGTLVTKDALLDAVWGHRHVSESVLKTTISELRAALADDARQPRYIETASRRGYRFIGQFTHRPAPQPAETPRTAPPKQPSGFIGRESALAKLRAAWQRSLAGERQLVWIAGEAGVGKSKLIEAFVSELGPGSVTYGQCVEHFGTGEPYLPLIEAIAELCRREPELLQIMRAAAPTWLIQMPWLVPEADRANLHREVSGAHQDRMVREMREMMDRYTANRPLLFVLEDLHWSDQGTLRMMEHFARRPRPVKLLWIASFRLTQVIAEEHPLRELRQELRLHRLCEEILLEPFSESEVGAYLQNRLPGTRFPEAFVQRLHAHTEGLPLFLANVADTLSPQLADPAAIQGLLEASSAAALPVPDSLAGVIEKQIGRLPLDVQSVLAAASVHGMEFRASQLAEMVGRDPQWISERCDELVKRQIWLRHVDIIELPDGSFDTRYAFLHALYRHVFYQRLSLPQRVQLHRRTVQLLEAARARGEPVTAAELALHCERGHQPLAALGYYAEAAEYAVGHFAPLEAVNVTSGALKLLDRCPEGRQRMEAELALVHKRGIACAQLYGVASADAVMCFERAHALCEMLPETPQRALLLNGLGLTRYVKGDYIQARAIADAVKVVGERYGDPVLLICNHLLRGMILAVQAEHQASRDSFDLGLAVCRQIGEQQVPTTPFIVDPIVALRTNLAMPLMHLALADQAREQVRLASIRAEQLGQPTARMLVWWVGGMIELRCGAPEKVAQLAQSLIEFVEQKMLTQGGGPAFWLRGWAQTRLGSPQAGYELIREGYERHARLGMFAGNTESLCHAADALLLMGDLQRAESQIDEAKQLADRIGERLELPNMLLLRARLAQAQQRPADAKNFLQAALAEARAQRSPYYEMKSLIALCERDDAGRDDRDALRCVHGSLTEGFDLPMVKRAAALAADREL